MARHGRTSTDADSVVDDPVGEPVGDPVGDPVAEPVAAADESPTDPSAYVVGVPVAAPVATPAPPVIPIDDDARETAGVVTGAVSIGTAPLPFLAVYAVLFILHGAVHPVHPPDITTTQTGELICGVVAAVLFVLMSMTLLQFLNRHRRWPFAVGQAAVLGASVYFLQDNTVSGAAISGLLVATTIVSLALGFAPDGWRHVGQPVPPLVRRVYRERGTGSDAATEQARESATEPATESVTE